MLFPKLVADLLYDLGMSWHEAEFAGLCCFEYIDELKLNTLPNNSHDRIDTKEIANQD